MNPSNPNEKETQNLKVKPPAQRKPASLFKKVLKYSTLGCASFYGIIFIILLFEFIFIAKMDPNQLGATFDEGTVASIAELPIVGHDLGELKTEGQIHYITRKGYKSPRLNYLITGKTNVEEFEEYRKRNLLINYWKCDKQRLRLLRHTIDLMMADIDKFPSTFSKDDYYGEAIIEALGVECLTSTIIFLQFWFRPDDGQFFMLAELELTKGDIQSAIREKPFILKKREIEEIDTGLPPIEEE